MNAWKRDTRTPICWVTEGVIIMAAIIALLVVAPGCGRRTVKEIRVTAGYVWLAQSNLEQYADEMEAGNPQGAHLLRAMSRGLAKAVVECNRRRLRGVLIRDRYRRGAGDILDLAESSIGPSQATTRPSRPAEAPGSPSGPSEAPRAASEAPRPTTRTTGLRPVAYPTGETPVVR